MREESRNRNYDFKYVGIVIMTLLGLQTDDKRPNDKHSISNSWSLWVSLFNVDWIDG